MARKVDLAKAKAGDKVRFVAGNTAIIESIEIHPTFPGKTPNYTVTFQDGTVAAFAQNGKVMSSRSFFTDGFPFGALDAKDSIASVTTPRRTPNSLSLSRAFNIASRSLGDDHSRHPALEFQTLNHMRGIAGRYQIPGNYTAPEYEDRMSHIVIAASKPMLTGKERRNFWDVLETIAPPQQLEESWKELVQLNPVLKKVKFNEADAAEMYNAHLGVTSGFNVDDINFFLEQSHIGDGLPARQAHEMPVHGERLNRIDAKAKAPMFWVASPKTAEKVEARLDRRRKREAKALKHG
jgi:hypothetical protein